MKILILGGTLFLGRALVAAALERGHEVTLFNRGTRSGEVPPQVEQLRGDRDGGLDALRGRSWDVAIDTCGYLPRLVRASAELLADSVRRYVFISSISVYADFGRPIDEDAPVASLGAQSAEEVTGTSYGALKALCEQAVDAAMPGRTLVVRPGLIVGPHDPTVRFSYWTERVARGGEVLAPGDAASPVQIIDARDLADWTIRMAEAGETGVFNATGPEHLLTMRAFLEACRAASGSDARFAWVDEDFLLDRGVEPWSHLPLWLPQGRGTHRFFHRAPIARALSAGLTFRPLLDTIRDTLAWQRARGAEALPEKAGVAMPDQTLSPERERALLGEWDESRRAAALAPAPPGGYGPDETPSCRGE